MSSDMKDARWALALHRAELEGREYEDYTYEEFQSLLDAAQVILDDNPESILYWANKFREQGDE